ncbi:MAG: hypothetical protein WB822_05970 [Rhodoplanes sp.]
MSFGEAPSLSAMRQMIDAGPMKVAMTLLAIAVQIVGVSADASARDRGNYNEVPGYIRDWFKGLRNPRYGVNCCDQSDCSRTEARTQGNQWQAKTPDGSWIAIPDDKVVNNQDNPTGEPILCALENRAKELGWEVICFVPGPGS